INRECWGSRFGSHADSISASSSFLLVFVHHFELGIDDVTLVFAGTFFFWSRLAFGPPGSRSPPWPSARRSLLIEVGTNFLKLVLQIVISSLHRLRLIPLDCVADGFDRILYLLALCFGDFVTKVLQLLLALVSKGVGVVLDFDRFFRLLVF